jgi:hypothetical protein
LQSRFQRFVLEGGNEISENVTAADSASGAKRLAIYADAYALRLEEALRADYRGLHAVLGDTEFARLTRDYLRAHPSHCRSIRWFGSLLPDFLGATKDWNQRTLLAEMAHFDWQLSLALDAEDALALRMEHLATLAADDWPALTFRLQSAVSRLDLRWNVPALRNALLAEEVVPDPESHEHPIGWLIWRGELNARFRSLSVHEAWAIDTAASGGSFATICEGLCEWIDPANSAMEAASLLKRWVVDELLLAPNAAHSR